MLQCEVLFHEKVDFTPSDRQDGGQSDSTSEGSVQTCFFSTINYHLALFNDKSNEQPFYEVTLRELSSKLDSDKKSITLTHKKSDCPLLTIYASMVVVEKIESMCQEFSDGKVTWNLLMNTPYSRSKDSYLSNINEKSNFKGIVTLLAVISIFAKARDIIESHFTYGRLPLDDFGSNKIFMLAYALSSFALNLIMMMIVEKFGFKKMISQKTTAFIETLNILLAYAFPIYFCCTYKPHIILAVGYSLTAVIVILKMISYVHFMHDLRNSLPKILSSGTEKESVRMEASQENLAIIQKHENDLSGLVNLGDILYFCFAPVLIYQLWYPRTESINKRRAFRLGAEIILFLTFQLYWLNQHIIPIMKTSTETFQNGTIMQIVDKFLEASNTYLPYIVINAYSFFHILPNFFAEITRFSNRDFYSDWWNNTSIRTFWNRWNLPIHKWCVRHIYNPLQQRGYSKTVSTCAVFLFSGIMHEYLYCVPIRFMTFDAILGLSLQAPMMIFEKKYRRFFEKYYIGNIFMWVGVWCFTVTVGVVKYRMKYLEINGAAN